MIMAVNISKFFEKEARFDDILVGSHSILHDSQCTLFNNESRHEGILLEGGMNVGNV